MICLKVLSQLLHGLVTTTPAVFRVPLHYQELQHFKISCMRSRQTVTSIAPKAQKDWNWWHTQLPLHPCSPIVQKEASVVIESRSDALLQGRGANGEGMNASRI